jgi:hypothetical protein
MEHVGNMLDGASFFGLNLLLVMLPTFVALWLGIRAVRALERAAHAQAATAQYLANIALMLEQEARARRRVGM